MENWVRNQMKEEGTEANMIPGRAKSGRIGWSLLLGVISGLKVRIMRSPASEFSI